jgi:hypothetical protein
MHGRSIAYQVQASLVSARHAVASAIARHGSSVVVVVGAGVVGVPPPVEPVVEPPPPETTVPPETTSPQPQSHAHGGQSWPSGHATGHAHAQPPPGPFGSGR